MEPDGTSTGSLFHVHFPEKICIVKAWSSHRRNAPEIEPQTARPWMWLWDVTPQIGELAGLWHWVYHGLEKHDPDLDTFSPGPVCRS